MVTLKDIAREAGVSVMTVSNVINRKYSRVSKEKADQIRQIIKKHNYVPNLSARSLAKNNSKIISIILRGEANENILNNPHHATLLGMVIQKVQEQGYYTMVNKIVSPEDVLPNLRTWNIQGAILLGMFDDEIEKMYRATDIQLVFIDSYSKIRQLSNVGINDYKGGQLAADYLIQRGHRKIAFVGPPLKSNGVMRHRFEGFLSRLKENGLSFTQKQHFVVESDVHPAEIVETGQKMSQLRDNITAAFVTSDQIVPYLIRGLRENGVTVPRDFSIIGFDNSMLSTLMVPQLTTIAQDISKKAELAVEILFRQLQSANSPAESLVLDVELIERESVVSI